MTFCICLVSALDGSVCGVSCLCGLIRSPRRHIVKDRNRPHSEQKPLDRRTVTGYIIGVGGRNPRASRSGEPLYRTARITFTSNSFSFARCEPGKHHTTTATIWHNEGTTAEEDAREVREALSVVLRGESARVVSWELVPLAS